MSTIVNNTENVTVVQAKASAKAPAIRIPDRHNKMMAFGFWLANAINLTDDQMHNALGVLCLSGSNAEVKLAYDTWEESVDVHIKTMKEFQKNARKSTVNKSKRTKKEIVIMPPPENTTDTPDVTVLPVKKGRKKAVSKVAVADEVPPDASDIDMELVNKLVATALVAVPKKVSKKSAVAKDADSSVKKTKSTVSAVVPEATMEVVPEVAAASIVAPEEVAAASIAAPEEVAAATDAVVPKKVSKKSTTAKDTDAPSKVKKVVKKAMKSTVVEDTPSAPTCMPEVAVVVQEKVSEDKAVEVMDDDDDGMEEIVTREIIIDGVICLIDDDDNLYHRETNEFIRVHIA